MLSDKEANEMLAKLREHYNEPVLTLSSFCQALQSWANCIEDGVRDNKHEPGGPNQQGREYAESLSRIITDIHKSNLLFRILFRNEEVRKEKCPKHDGHWSGLEGLHDPCPHGCHLTGWLPNKK